MFQEINKLSDLLFGLFHSSNIIEFDFDVSDSFYFEALFGWYFRHKRIRGEPAEDEDSNGYSDEGGQKGKSINKGLCNWVIISIEKYLAFLKPSFLLYFDHRQQIIDISIVFEPFLTLIFILKSDIVLATFVFVNFFNVDCFQSLEEFRHQVFFVDFGLWEVWGLGKLRLFLGHTGVQQQEN